LRRKYLVSLRRSADGTNIEGKLTREGVDSSVLNDILTFNIPHDVTDMTNFVHITFYEGILVLGEVINVPQPIDYSSLPFSMHDVEGILTSGIAWYYDGQKQIL
jgi:hypothetical protein